MKKALIIIDCQQDFISGALGFPEAGQIVAHIADKAAQGDWADIWLTLDTHDAAFYSCSREGRHLPIAHCIKGTPGHALDPRLQPFAAPDRCIEKNTFGSDRLLHVLQDGDYDEVHLCGIVTDICVLSNMVIAATALPDARIIIDRRCVGSPDQKMQQMALELMEHLHAEII